MKFEIIDTQGKILMNTSSPSECIYKETLESIHNAGFRFRIDNKIVSLKKALEYAK